MKIGVYRTHYTVKKKFDMDTLKEAKQFVNKYKRTLNTLFAWEDRHKKKARKQGTVYTYFGRPRRLKWYFDHPDSGMRAFAYRSAVNTVIQGCHPYKTKILTNEGYYPIGELENNYAGGKEIPNKVWTGENWADYVPIQRDEKDIYKVTTNCGRTIKCDNTHKFKVVTDGGYQWKQLKDIKEGDKLAINQESVDVNNNREYEGYNYIGETGNSNNFNISTEDYDYLYYLMGYITGDGYICNQKREDTGYFRRYIKICFGEYELDRFYDMKEKLESWGLRVSTKKDTHKPAEKESTRFSLQIRSKGLIEFFESLGFEPNKTCYDKEVPKSVWRGKPNDVYWFLKGLFDSDGAENNASLNLANKKLLQEVQVLVSQFGFDTYLMDKDKGAKLYFRDSQSYLNFLENRTIERFVGRQVYKNAPEFLKNEFKDKLANTNLKRGVEQTVYSRVRRGGNSSVGYMTNMMKKYNKQFNTLYWEDEIVKIEKLNRTETVYTLSVADEKHQYVAEGFISKNCGSDILKIAMIKLWNNLLKKPEYKDDVIFMSTVHDEVNLSIRKSRLEEILPKVMECMELEVPGWEVPMECDAEIGHNWGHMFEFERDEDGNYVPVTEPAEDYDM